MNPKLKIIITLVAMLGILLGIYMAGNFTLANSIKSSYQSKNCEQVLAQSSFYASVYPASIADQSVADMASECALYVLAVESEGKRAWQDAYNAYQKYMQSYPRGFFVSEAQEHSALALTALAKEQLGAKKYTEALATIDMVQQSFGKTNAAKEAASLTPEIYLAWAKEQLAAKKYTDAIGNINLVLQGFDGTSASNDATSLMSEVYTTWAKDQRDSGDFAGAETTLKTFKIWANDVKKTDAVKSAQGELAQTYLAWGLDFQNKKQFEDAKAKFDQAIAADPEPAASDGPAVQAKAAQAKLYIDWGDTLSEKNDLKGALSHYQTALSLSGSKDQPALKDKIAAAHLKLADTLKNSEDFIGALKEVEQTKEIAATDSAKKDVETAQASLYQAFSQSTGEQAQQAILDAAEKVCSHQQPELPIFGTDSNAIHAFLFPKGEGALIDAVAATTPASLHYVACVVTDSTKTETRKMTIGTPDGKHITPNSYFSAERITTYWDIQLYDLKTGKMIATQLFAGSAPPNWERVLTFINNNDNTSDISFPGTLPSLKTISDWVEKYMK